MNILVVGAGRIGSVFALHLALAGHTVSVVARGARHAQLRHSGAICTTDGQQAPVRVLGDIDTATAYDLLIVTVMAHQMETLLPALAVSRAQAVMLLFNSFGCSPRWREQIGTQRLVIGFPNMTAFLVDERLRHRVNGPGMMTTISSTAWVETLRQAGLPAEVEPDMDSFLRSHVAMVVPLMLAANWTWQRDHALTWHEARQLATAWQEGFALVRFLGQVKPGLLGLRLPAWALCSLLWAVARLGPVRLLGEFGPGEVGALIDAMGAAAPSHIDVKTLLTLRPPRKG